MAEVTTRAVGSGVGGKLNDRYEIVRVVARGGFGEMLHAIDTQTNQSVAIKRLSLSQVGNWRAVDLFEREAEVLRTLEHPSIPKYYDFFTTEEGVHLHLVQELVDGASLADEIATQRRYVEAEVRDIAERVLSTLVYLQELNPPVFHRDIKPSNLVQRHDGRLFLVDFGSVRCALQSSGSLADTVAGTWGYMAPEQLHGRAERATDLYGLGATLLHLLTHREPTDFARERLKIVLDAKALSVSEAFGNWLAKMLEPAPEDRFASARAALDALGRLDTLEAVASRVLRVPVGSRLEVSRAESELEIVIPGHGLRAGKLSRLGSAAFTLAFIVFWTALALRGSSWFAAFSIPFWIVSARAMASALFDAFGHTRVSIGAGSFEISRALFGFHRTRSGAADELDSAVVETREHKGRRSTTVERLLVLRQGAHEHHLGRHLGDAEREWLVRVLNKFLKKQRRALNAG